MLVVAERQDRLRQKETVRFLSLVRSLPIQVIQWLNLDITQSLVNLARERDLSVYDANYLWIAMQENLPVATLDNSLQEVCSTVDVQLYDP